MHHGGQSPDRLWLAAVRRWRQFVGGVTGAVITGIMFGVRKGKLRRLEHRMAYENSRAIRWDPASSRFVF
jgi:hypothetical protein